jgi:hypothetical protein
VLDGSHALLQVYVAHREGHSLRNPAQMEKQPDEHLVPEAGGRPFQKPDILRVKAGVLASGETWGLHQAVVTCRVPPKLSGA